jgi:predicted acylesterase/phospholipase RssA
MVGQAPVLSRTWRTPTELVARAAGASWVLGRSALRLPFPGPPAALSRVFPGALAAAYDPANIDTLPQHWPQRPLWAVAVNLGSGRRAALGRHPADRAEPFPHAIRASTALPGVFAPVRFGDRVLVDGGVHSTTNLDLAVLAAPDTVICIARWPTTRPIRRVDYAGHCGRRSTSSYAARYPRCVGAVPGTAAAPRRRPTCGISDQLPTSCRRRADRQGRLHPHDRAAQWSSGTESCCGTHVATWVSTDCFRPRRVTLS